MNESDVTLRFPTFLNRFSSSLDENEEMHPPVGDKARQNHTEQDLSDDVMSSQSRSVTSTSVMKSEDEMKMSHIITLVCRMVIALDSQY